MTNATAPKYATDIHMGLGNATFVAELVRQSRREALDADDAATAQRCDDILRSIDFAIYMATNPA